MKTIKASNEIFVILSIFILNVNTHFEIVNL